jgi:hypothetical protein
MPLERALSGLVATPRDVNRLANAVAGAIDLHGGEVAVVDLVGLEALRMIEPDVHARLDSVADILLGEDWRSFFESDDEVKRDRANRLNKLLSRASARDATLLLLQQLFPAGRADLGGGRPQKDDDQEDRANRVTVRRIFWRYVHATIPETDVSSSEVQTVADALNNPPEFARRISEYQDKRLGDMLTRLSGYWENFDLGNVVPLGQVLLNIGTRLHDDESPFRMRLEPAVWQFERLLGRLLASEPDRRRRAENVRELIRGAPHLSARMRLIVWFGTFPQREGRGEDRDMLTEQQTRRLMAGLRREILGAAPTDLASEVELSLLMREALSVDHRRAQRRLATKARDSVFALALLRECIVSVNTGSTTRYEFHWRQFTETVGESAARRVVLSLSSQVQPDDYDFRTREGIRQAVAVARGEAEPSKLFDDLARVS